MSREQDEIFSSSSEEENPFDTPDKDKKKKKKKRSKKMKHFKHKSFKDTDVKASLTKITEEDAHPQDELNTVRLTEQVDNNANLTKVGDNAARQDE
jgi:hypothetical protein